MSPGTACTRGERYEAQWGCTYISGRRRVMPTYPSFPQVSGYGASPLVALYKEISASTASNLRSITEGTEIALMARSGSLSP